jgi:hypothetical protein
MWMIFALLLLLQDKVEMKDVKSSYLLTRPTGYSDRVSWPAILDLGGGAGAPREPDSFVVTPADPRNEAATLACLTDLKTKYRVNPERVIVRGGAEALALAAAHLELFGGCAIQLPRAFSPVSKAPPCVVFLSPREPDRGKIIASAMIMKRSGVDIEVRASTDAAGAILEAVGAKIRVRGDLPLADGFQREGRYLDATLVCIDLLEKPEVERLARTKLKSIEGMAIIEMSKVEIAVADRKLKDAVLRCREAARQFAWVPPGERIRKRLAELESRADVQRALETDD